jgi:hypothetical protein
MNKCMIRIPERKEWVTGTEKKKLWKSKFIGSREIVNGKTE